MVFVCVSQQGEFKNTIKPFGESPCQKLLAEEVERKQIIFPVVFISLRFAFFS
jgi:hypothetical protein